MLGLLEHKYPVLFASCLAADAASLRKMGSACAPGLPRVTADGARMRLSFASSRHGPTGMGFFCLDDKKFRSNRVLGFVVV